MGVLDGLRILVPESRQLDLFASMIEDSGGRVVRCPLVQILDLDDSREAEVWIDELIDGEFQDLIWLTGEGLRRLRRVARRMKREDQFIAAVGKIRSITRGPKPVRELHEIGLSAGLVAPAPTSEGIIEALAPEDIDGRAIGVQLYPGDGTAHLLDHLRARGAIISPVTPYRYASRAETTQVITVIKDMIAGRIDVVAFTSSPQVERLFSVARDAGLEVQLNEALQRMGVASIGPVVEETLKRRGIENVMQPESVFHLKPLVRAIASWKEGQSSGT